MTNTRVILADDNPLIRASIRNILNKAPGIEVVGEASNGYEALHLVKALAPDVLLLDMEMPGLKGVEVAQQLQRAGSAINILALSTYDDKEYILGLLACGASGYLIKEEAPETIIKAVRGVARGEKGWLSRRVSDRISTLPAQKQAEERELTEPERAILRLIVRGKTNQEIGLVLDIDEERVASRLEAIFTKLKVTSRVEAAMRAVQEGFI